MSSKEITKPRTKESYALQQSPSGQSLQQSPLGQSSSLQPKAKAITGFESPTLISPALFQSPLAIVNKFMPLQQSASSSSLKESEGFITPKKTFKQTLQQSSPIATVSTSALKQIEKYQDKPGCEEICVLEKEHGDPNPSQINNLIKNIFYPNFHFLPTDISKTREYYEFILVATDSIEIFHHEDPKIKNKYIYSKIKILKVISLSNWGQSPYTPKTFPYRYFPSTYDYFDYQNAWYNVIYYSNMNHSWFIHFGQNCKGPFPKWFLKWWELIGPNTEILPTEIIQGYNYFLKEINKKDQLSSLLQYFTIFKLAWIICWTYNIQDQEDYKVLIRKIRIKWWASMKTSQGCINAVQQWIVRNKPQINFQSDPSQVEYCMKKAQLTARLAQAQNEDELAAILQEAANKFSPAGSQSGSQQDQPDNEDDCYGIFSPLD